MKKHRFGEEYLTTMVSLATAGFGLVAALAWNDLIQNLIQQYIPIGGGALSRFIYALVVTFLAVFITSELGKLKARVQQLEEELERKKEQQ